jgi:hypothetical protein
MHQQYQGGRRLAGCRDRGTGQQDIRAITGAAALGGNVFRLTEEPTAHPPARPTDEAFGLEVALQPDQAAARI